MDKNLKSIFTETPECLPADELEALLGTPAADERWLPARAHLAQCPHCQAELAMLSSFLSPEVSAEERPHVQAIVQRLRANSPAATEPWWRRVFRPAALVPVALALTAIAVVLTFQVDRRNAELTGAAPGSQVMRSQTVEAIEPVGAVASVPEVLSWKPVAGAAKYAVRLMEVDRTILWSEQATSTSVIIPAQIRSKITPLKTLVWEVEAMDASNNVLASTGLKRFKLESATTH
jgi:hypothetical protein